MKKRIIIPPYWPEFLIGAIFLPLGIWNFLTHPSPKYVKYSRMKPWYLAVIAFIIFMRGSIHYSISHRGVTVRFLMIPIRLIKWENIANAQYINTWQMTEKAGKRKGKGIVFTTAKCPVFAPEIDGLETYQLKHPLSFFFIHFSTSQHKRYVEAFRHYYPELKFQSGSDLSAMGDDAVYPFISGEQ